MFLSHVHRNNIWGWRGFWLLHRFSLALTQNIRLRCFCVSLHHCRSQTSVHLSDISQAGKHRVHSRCCSLLFSLFWKLMVKWMEKRRNTITYVAYSDIIPDCLVTMVTPHTKAFPTCMLMMTTLLWFLRRQSKGTCTDWVLYTITLNISLLH